MSFHTRRYTAEHHDHERDLAKHDPRPSDLPFSQRLALAQICGYCEGVVSSGILGQDMEFRLREILAETLSAFGMPSKSERGGNA